MKPTALVVDDALGVRALLSAILEREGYTVQTAEHGGPALDIMRASHDHLLVTLGLIMPNINGQAVLEAIATDKSLAQRHALIVVTAAEELATSGRVQELRERLAIPLVVKPIKVHQLLAAIEEAEQRWTVRHNVANANDSGEG